MMAIVVTPFFIISLSLFMFPSTRDKKLTDSVWLFGKKTVARIFRNEEKRIAILLANHLTFNMYIFNRYIFHNKIKVLRVGFEK